MIIPVRCFSCGKVIAHMWNEFCELVEQGVDAGYDNNNNSEKLWTN